MASVTVQRPSSGNVTKSVRTTATVSFAGGTPFTVPAGLLVMAVPVQAGQTVKAGDTLAVFDAAEVDRAVNAKRPRCSRPGPRPHNRRRETPPTPTPPSSPSSN